MDMQGFYKGNSFDAYEWLGAHFSDDGVIFRTYAPNATKVELILENNIFPMKKIYDGNFYEVIVQNVEPGSLYEYRIYHRDGKDQIHCDPYGFGMELRPKHKSIVRDLKEYVFQDGAWMRNRAAMFDKPLNVYEMHMGSWKKNQDEWYRYDELTDLLIPYLKEKGYNYVEFLPLSEHPCDESWGYQNTGFFAPTSRYGTSRDLMVLIDKLHQNNIGAILDFVPVHFAVDSYALATYDGTALYEYPHQDVGVSEWGSYNFLHSRGEVRSFLQSAANYWLKEYHFDGLRMDAISRMIYWQGDENRGENGKAVEFIKVMNQGLKERNPGILLAAEDSTSYPKVTAPVRYDGLGFDYKWDMGWMHDTLEYFQAPPKERIEKYHKLTFSMVYFYNEKYMLALSHDEVVHGKATIIQKMNGGYDVKFPQARALYMYMYAHPGKKLNFMGNEIGQFREWDEQREQDWDILKYPAHDSFARYMKDLCSIYQNNSALYERDYDQAGFNWIDCHQEEKCIYVFERVGNGQRILFIFNFSDKKQVYTFKNADFNSMKLLLASDNEIYGGCENYSKKRSTRLKEGTAEIKINAFTGLMYEIK